MIWEGRAESSLTLEGAGEGFPEAASETHQKKGGGAGSGTEGGTKGYGKTGRKTKTKVLFYFLCCYSNFLKGHLEKRRKWFQKLLFFASSNLKLG